MPTWNKMTEVNSEAVGKKNNLGGICNKVLSKAYMTELHGSVSLINVSIVVS